MQEVSSFVLGILPPLCEVQQQYLYHVCLAMYYLPPSAVVFLGGTTLLVRRLFELQIEEGRGRSGRKATGRQLEDLKRYVPRR